MRKKAWLIGLAAVVLPLALIGLTVLALGHFVPVRAGSLATLSFTPAQDALPKGAENAELGLEVSASSVQTWTHTTRADWEAGTLEILDSATVSGSLQLMQRLFGESTTITPREDLGSGQTGPGIAADTSGNLYAVWSDGRNGNTDIYFAYRAAISTTWSASVRVNDDTGMAQQYDPAVVVDSSGNTYAVWVDERSGKPDMYFAYRPVGGSWGANVKVNDTAGTVSSWHSRPAIAVDSSGNIYAVWEDSRNDSGDIYFAYRPAGGNWSPNVRVNDDTGTTRQFGPAIAVDTSGNAYVVWADQRSNESQYQSRGDIYFAYRPVGGHWGANVRVDDAPGTEGQSYPAIAVDGSGNAYAIWDDGREDNPGIYFAYRPAGGSWGVNVRVDDDPGADYDPAIAVDSGANAYAVWEDHRNAVDWGQSDIYFAYRPAGGGWGANVKVNDDTGTAAQSDPAISADASGNAYAVWQDERNGNPDIYFASRPAGSVWDTNVRVDDDVSGGASQDAPAIAVDESGNAYAVWQDNRSGNGDIYFAYQPAGGDWGTNVKVNDDTGTAWQYGGYGHAIAVDSSGNAYAAWMDERNDDRDVYFAYRAAVSTTWSANIRVDDDPGTAPVGYPVISVDASGNAYAIWDDNRNDQWNAYFAYRPTGGNWGANVRVSDDDNASAAASTIAVDPSGDAYAVWMDYRNGDYDIYFSYRAAVSTTWGANIRVNDDTGTAWQQMPNIAVDASGNAYVTWGLDWIFGNRDTYFAYRPTGGSWESGVKIPGSARFSDIAVDDTGNAYAVGDGAYVYLTHRPAGGYWGANVKVNDDPGPAWSPGIAVEGTGRIYVVWVDDSYGTGHIRFARSLDTPEYAIDGRYTSSELDTGVTAATWESFAWQGNTPAGTSLTFETRSRIAGGAWSPWESVIDTIASPPGQYLQYRVAFSTAVTDTTPILEQVQITYRSAGTPSAPRFATSCGVTNQTTPTLRGSAAGGSVVHLYVYGGKVTTTTAGTDGTFTSIPELSAGSHTLTAVAENESGVGPASTPLKLGVSPALSYDPINVRAGQWSKDGWLMSVPRDANGCADPGNDWRIWPRENQRLRVEVPVSYTTSAAVTVTVGTAMITLTEESDGLFTGVFQPPINGGDFVIEVNADGATTIVDGGPVLIDPDGVVYEASGTISDTIPGVLVTCYYSDTHSGQWLTWDAWTYDQVNPQVTLDDGYYSFYPPPGTYRAVAEKEGYQTYTSPDLAVADTPVRHNVPLEKVMYEIYLPLVLRNH